MEESELKIGEARHCRSSYNTTLHRWVSRTALRAQRLARPLSRQCLSVRVSGSSHMLWNAPNLKALSTGAVGVMPVVRRRRGLKP
jgi:hypothetical protein